MVQFFGGGDNDSNNIFKLQKRVIRIISGISKHTSCRQIFKDYNILTVTRSYGTYLKQYVTLKSTKIHWNKMYNFITIIQEENWIYMFNFAIRTFSRKVW
jgi:hypothetical protein